MTGRNARLLKLPTAALACTALTAALATSGLWLAPAGSTASSRASSAASSVASSRASSVTDYARLTLVSANGNTLVERGKASGTLPGTVQVSLTLRNRTASSSFTIHTSAGTIGGHGQGKLKAGKHGYDSFGGWVVVSGGTGRFRGAHGKGGLYGAIYRVTDAMTVQVTGKLYY